MLTNLTFSMNNAQLKGHIFVLKISCFLFQNLKSAVFSEAGFLVWLGYVPVLNYVPFR
jgi:hypothetical protein